MNAAQAISAAAAVTATGHVRSPPRSHRTTASNNTAHHQPIRGVFPEISLRSIATTHSSLSHSHHQPLTVRIVVYPPGTLLGGRFLALIEQRRELVADFVGLAFEFVQELAPFVINLAVSEKHPSQPGTMKASIILNLDWPGFPFSRSYCGLEAPYLTITSAGTSLRLMGSQLPCLHFCQPLSGE